MPIYHADGWCFSLLLPFLFGSSVLLTPPFNAQVAGRFDSLLASHGANAMIAVPSMLAALLAMRPRYRLPVEGRLRFMLCGSARLHQEQRERFEQQFATRILENYGLTETLLIAYETPDQPSRPGSVGRLARQCRVRIADDGEILASSPFLFSAYYRDAQRTAAVFDGTWFHTGDVGYLDEQGYLYLTGRKRDLINRAGKKIDPHAIDEALLRLAGVADAATIGVEDTLYGQEIYAFVAPAPGQRLDGALLLEQLRPQLERERWPKDLLVLPSIPRNHSGKVIVESLLASLAS